MSIGFGIIGCGGIARFHFDALAQIGATVAHVCDIDSEVAAPYVERFGCAYSADAKALFRDPAVTVVEVLTSTAGHKELCIAALQAGKDVICEKTLANTESEAFQIAKATADSGRLFYTGYMKRFFPAVVKLRDLLPSLGRVFSATVRANQNWGNFYETDDPGSFGIVFEKYGGAVMKCAGSHMIDMTLSIFGLPQKVVASVDYVGDTNFDRKASALFLYPDGFVVNFETATHPLSKIGYERNAWEEWIQISGTAGRVELHTVKWDEPLNNPVKLLHYDEETGTTSEYHFEPTNPFLHELEAIIGDLETRTQGRPDVVDGYNVDLLIQRMAESHREGRVIPVEARVSR